MIGNDDRINHVVIRVFQSQSQKSIGVKTGKKKEEEKNKRFHKKKRKKKKC